MVIEFENQFWEDKYDYIGVVNLDENNIDDNCSMGYPIIAPDRERLAASSGSFKFCPSAYVNLSHRSGSSKSSAMLGVEISGEIGTYKF